MVTWYPVLMPEGRRFAQRAGVGQPTFSIPSATFWRAM